MPFRRYSTFAIAPLILAAATPGMAAPILYTVAGTGSGTLNGEAFDDQAIAISLIADPDSDIASFGLAPTSQTVQIGSLGMFDFTNQVYFGTSFANVFYLAGVNTTRFVADFLDVQLPGYVDIYAPFATVTGDVANPPALRQFDSIATSGGALTLTQATAFTIRGVDPTAAVPEPAVWTLMIAGFGVIGASMRRSRVTMRIAYER